MAQKTVLITGGGSGIGFAIGQSLLAIGLHVVLAGRSEERLKEATFALPGSISQSIDVTDEGSVIEAFETLKGKNLLPDLLINNAGAASTAPFERTTTKQWNQMLAVNLTGAFLCSRAALPHMKKQKFGRIINVASTAGLKGYAYTSAYVAAKHGVVGMTKALALELAGTGVTANAVCPGFTDTDIVRTAVDTISAKTGRTEAEALAELTKSNPAGRLITPDEVASTVAWLCSDAASAINGQAIAVDCGETIS